MSDTPTTEAGKVLLEECVETQKAIDREWGRYPNDPPPFDYAGAILAIEAEARAECEERNRRLQQTIDLLSRDGIHTFTDEGLGQVQAEARAAVLRELRAEVEGLVRGDYYLRGFKATVLAAIDRRLEP